MKKIILSAVLICTAIAGYTSYSYATNKSANLLFASNLEALTQDQGETPPCNPNKHHSKMAQMTGPYNTDSSNSGSASVTTNGGTTTASASGSSSSSATLTGDWYVFTYCDWALFDKVCNECQTGYIVHLKDGSTYSGFSLTSLTRLK